MNHSSSIVFGLVSLVCFLQSVIFCLESCVCGLSSANGTSTSVENPLQISYFMQNKPNFRKSQMNVNPYNTMNYENISDWTLGENKPNSNPISIKAKMSANLYVIEDYENETAFRLQKNKPKQTQFPKGQNELKIACRKIWPHPFYIAGHKNIDEHLNSQYTTART